MEWTQQDEQILANNWGHNEDVKSWMHLLPGRDERAIRMHAYRKGLGRNKDDRMPWTEAETQILKEHWYGRQSIKHWADKLPGRTIEGIRSYAKRINLGVRRRPCISEVWKDVKAVLSDGRKRSVAQLVAETGWEDRGIRRQIREHIGEEIYISQWLSKTETGTQPTALFSLGKKKNAAKPKPVPMKVCQRNYIKRIKKEKPEVFAKKLAKDKFRKAEKRGMLIRPDEAASWMFNRI